MKMEDFQLCKNDEGMEFVQFTEGPTKTRQGGLRSKNRDFQPRMFSVGGERCPVALFKHFVERRPLNMQWSGPFYLSIKTNRRLNDNIWLKTQPMGVNTISSMMKTSVAGTSLEESHKKFKNHSARKTTVSKLKKANVERSDIVKVTGHRSVQSLDDYDKADEEEQRRLSSAISKRNYENPSAEKNEQMAVADITTTAAPLAPVNTNVPVPHTLASPSMTATKENQFPPTLPGFQAQNFSLNPTMMRSQEQTMMNMFNNCQVSFIIGRSKRAPETSKRQRSSCKRRAFIIEDDSDLTFTFPNYCKLSFLYINVKRLKGVKSVLTHFQVLI